MLAYLLKTRNSVKLVPLDGISTWLLVFLPGVKQIKYLVEQRYHFLGGDSTADETSFFKLFQPFNTRLTKEMCCPRYLLYPKVVRINIFFLQLRMQLQPLVNNVVVVIIQSLEMGKLDKRSLSCSIFYKRAIGINKLEKEIIR